MQIRPGDTLSRIARSLNTNVDELLRLNPEIRDRNKIRSGSELNVPADRFVDACGPTSTAPVTGSEAAGFEHTQFLRSQLGTASPELRADLEKDLRLLGRAAQGQLPLPAETQAVVTRLTQGLSAEERAVATAKAFELSSEGYSVESTGGARFAANLTLELSEYLATGAKASHELLDRMKGLYLEGQDVFTAKPELEQQLAGNLMLASQNLAARWE